jgi:hypothetical protein
MLDRGTITRVLTRLGAVAAAVAALGVLSAAPAYAGVWMQAICQNPNGTPAPIDGFAFSGQNVGQYGGASGGDSCPGGLGAAPSLRGGGVWASVAVDANAPTVATWTYSAPAGSTIAGGSISGVAIEQTTWGAPLNDMDAWISSPGDDASAADLVADCATPSSPSGGGLPGNAPCAENPAAQGLGPGAPPAPLVATINHSGGTALYMTAGCSTANTDPCSFVAGSYANLSFYARFAWADVLLSDATAPAAAGFGGSLLASGSAHGTADLAFTAQDPAAGVYQVIVKIDGNTIYQGTPNTNGGKCAAIGTDPTSGALIFDYQQPCPQIVAVDIPVNTTTLTDGQHDVQVVVQDPAQNSSTVLDQTITTKNLTTVASTTSEGLPAPPATAATYAFKLDAGSQRLASSIVRRRYDRSGVALSGTVLTSAGTPAPDVTVSVQAASVAGAGWTTVAQELTDASGHFKIAVSRGNSRQLMLTAGAHDVVFTQLVTPNITMRVRSLSGARLLFTGRVAINQAGNPRPLVELEDHTPKGWQPFANVTVNKAGRFRYVYPVSRLVTGYSFAFRAITPAVSGYWQGAASAVHKATVQG